MKESMTPTSMGDINIYYVIRLNSDREQKHQLMKNNTIELACIEGGWRMMQISFTVQKRNHYEVRYPITKKVNINVNIISQTKKSNA